MNYCTITIKEETIGLKFGMASFRYLSEGRFVEGKSYTNNELNEIGIAHILYSGYYNNCIVKDIDTKYTFEEFVDYVESALVTKSGMETITNVIKIWSDNEYIKQNKEQDNAKKKIIRGKK